MPLQTNSPRLLACSFFLLLAAAFSGSLFAAEGVVNHFITVNLDEASTRLSRNIAFDDGSLSLEAGTLDGVTASVAIESLQVATHLGTAWSGEGSLGLAVRTSLDGANWSDWVDVVADEHMTDPDTNTRYGRLLSIPGGYRFIQYSAGLARTQATGASPRIKSLGFSFIQAGSSASTASEPVVTDRPDMLSRTDWGCPDGETSSNNPNPTYTDVTHLIVHHTATSNTAADWAAEVRAIWSYHVQTRGWADIGYNFLVDPNGTIYVGRAGGDNVQGAHFSCQNGGTQGVSMLGNFTDIPPSDAALVSLENLLAWLASREGLDPAAVTWHTGTQLDLPVVSGHRDGNPSTTGCTVTACPGDTFYPMLPDVRVNVEALIAAAQIPNPVIENQPSEVVASFSGNSAEAEDCWGVFEINGHVLGNLFTAGNGCRLYRFEESGERFMLADINTAPGKEKYGNPGTSPPWPGPPFNGWVYFEGSSSANGFWRTDGMSVEAVLADEDWPQGGSVTGLGQMNGRLYFTVESAGGTPYFFSTDGQAYRSEPLFAGLEGQKARLVGSFFDRLLFVGSDADHGSEPRVFDGTEYRLLLDIVPGETGSHPRLFLPLDGQLVFAADKPGSDTGFFVTDGIETREIPLSGTLPLDPDPDDPVVRAGGSFNLVEDIAPVIITPSGARTGIVRLNATGASAYELPNERADTESPTAAILDNDALVTIENRFFTLGESSADERPFNFPTDQAGSRFAFIGSNPYFPRAYVLETNGDDLSQVWAWSTDALGVLMAGENNPVTRADHFTHIGNDIWFYGEDAVNGRAMRRISGVASKPVPWIGAVTGAWYDPATSGQGFVLHPIDNTRAVVSFYGYENDGSHLWLLGTAEAPIEIGVESEITMHISSGGQFGDFLPIDVNTVPWGTLRVTFHDCTRATVVLEGDHGEQTLETMRLAGLAGLECKAATPPMPRLSGVTGTWYDPDTAGQGLVLHAIDDSRVLVSFYGYRDDSSRLWLLDVYEGEPAFGEELALNLTEASGGRFGPFNPLDIERETWGTMTIEFHDCGEATATLTGSDGAQTLELVKLAGLDGSGRDCPSPESVTENRSD